MSIDYIAFFDTIRAVTSGWIIEESLQPLPAVTARIGLCRPAQRAACRLLEYLAHGNHGHIFRPQMQRELLHDFVFFGDFGRLGRVVGHG